MDISVPFRLLDCGTPCLRVVAHLFLRRAHDIDVISTELPRGWRWLRWIAVLEFAYSLLALRIELSVLGNTGRRCKGMASSAHCLGVLGSVEMSCSAPFACQVVGQLNCRRRIRLRGPESSSGYLSWYCGALR